MQSALHLVEHVIICTPENDRARRDGLGTLDENEFIIGYPLLHDLFGGAETAGLESLIAVEIRQTCDESASRGSCYALEVLFAASSDGHGACFNELFEAEIINTFGCKDDVCTGC